MPDGWATKFPWLTQANHVVTSLATGAYNCIAWAAGETTAWWWPNPTAYWPDGVPMESTVAAFIAAFGLLGYETCPTPNQEPGFEKVALFASAQGAPTHAARQLPNGAWTSKMGSGVDIQHQTLGAISGPEYGEVIAILRRPL